MQHNMLHQTYCVYTWAECFQKWNTFRLIKAPLRIFHSVLTVVGHVDKSGTAYCRTNFAFVSDSVKGTHHLFAWNQFIHTLKILKWSKENYPASNHHKKENKQQIFSFGLCAVNRFVAFLLTEQTRQRHHKRQDRDLQSPPWWSHLQT